MQEELWMHVFATGDEFDDKENDDSDEEDDEAPDEE